MCVYVEEEIPSQEEEVNKNAFFDPNLGCVSCQEEPLEQCVKKPQKTCQMVKDSSCQLCSSQRIAFDITNENEAFEKCDGNVSKDKFGRFVIYETKCKKFSAQRCKLARNLNYENCRQRKICYEKPKLLNQRSMKNMRCKSKQDRIQIRKVLRKAATKKSNCQLDCPKKEVCQIENVTECSVKKVRICDRLPPQKCQPKIKRRIVLKCTEIAEIPQDLYESLNSSQ